MKRYFGLIIPIVAFCGLLIITDIGCPIRYLTGIPCAGCGMTRAWWELIHLNFREAYMYHPLFWMPPIVCLIILMKRKIPTNIYTIIVGICICAFIVVYGIRLIHPDDIIVIELKSGELSKIFQ